MALGGKVVWLLVDRLLTTDNAGFAPFWHRPNCRRRRIFTGETIRAAATHSSPHTARVIYELFENNTVVVLRVAQMSAHESHWSVIFVRATTKIV